MKYYLNVSDDDDVVALQTIRSVLADSNHPDKAALIARLDGIIAPSHKTVQAYRTTWAANPGHAIPVNGDEQIALRLVRIGKDGESTITHQMLECPVPRGIYHEVLAYSTTAVIRSGDRAADQVAAWLKHEREIIGGQS